MTEIREPAVEPVTDHVMDRPGAALRAAREARGISVSDVAQALKFSPRQIEALESDEISGATSVFVRGFVRSYAKFLKLDPAPLLAMLQPEVVEPLPEVRAPENMGSAMPRSGVRQMPLLAATSVLLLVAAATMGAWHWMAPSESLPQPAAPEQRPVEPVQAVMPPQARVEQPAGAEPAPPQSASAPMPPADVKQLVFAFHGKSWIEVKDASHQIIFTGEYAAGSREVVAGKPPFQLVVGNAPLVELHYEDRAVDLKPHTRAEVARLTLE